ncbi:MAG: hypothetical protein ACRCTZ_09510 [Sarcina sp.]
MNKSEELVNEFADLIKRSVEECLSHKGEKDEEGRVYCHQCSFKWSYNLGNHGCFLVELYNSGQMDNLESAMDYNNMDTRKLQELEFMQD